MSEFGAALIGGLVGAIAGGGVTLAANIAQASLSTFAARYEELCRQILMAADVSSEYWLMEVASTRPDEQDRESKIEFFRAQLLEARIEGFQQQIILADEILRDELPKEIRRNIAIILPDLVNSLTGGTFKARTGEAHPVDASLVQCEAAKLMLEIKKGIQARYSLRYLLSRARGQH